MKYKKFLTGVIALCLTLSSAFTPALAEDYEQSEESGVIEEIIQSGDIETEPEYTDIMDKEAEDINNEEETEETPSADGNKISNVKSREYNLLSKLGIIDSDYEASAEVTRGIFAELLCKLVRLGGSSDKMFSDVNDETDGYKYIQMIAKSGVMIGFEDGTFRPDDGITYAQAVTAILKIAGYDKIAEKKGGYPNGYLSVASEHSLTGNYGIDSALTWEKTADLFYKALFLNIMSLESVGGGQISIAESEKTILEKFFGLIRGKGLVAASADIALGGREKTSKGEIIVSADDGEWIFSAGDSNIDNYVGYEAIYYYDENDEIFCFEINERRMKSVEVKEKDFISIDKSLTLLEYEENSKKSRNLKISDKADFVYNGVSEFEISRADFENADCIKLIDYDNDGRYDVVYLTVYSVYFVDNISKKTGIISDKREGIFLEIDEDEYDITYMKSGMETDINIIDEWDILSVAVSKNDGGNRKMTISITSDIIIGKVTSISEEDREIGIDNNDFYVSKKMDMSKLSMSENAVFGMNEFGAIVCFKRDKSNEKQYAYLLRVISELGAEDYELSLKVMNMYGEIVKLPVAEKFYINDEKSTFEGLKAMVVAGEDDGSIEGNFKAKNQVISVLFGNDEKVKRIYLAEEEMGAVDPAKPNALVLNKKFVNTRIRESEGTVNNEYIYTPETVCFKIINDANGNMIEELSGVFEKGQGKLIEGSRPNVSIYDAGKSRIAGALLLTLPLSNFTTYMDYDRQALVVTSVDTICDDNNNLITCITGFQGGQEVTYYPEESLSAENWNKGDVFIIYKSQNGKILTATKMFELKATPGHVLCPEKEYNDTYKALRNFATQASAESETTDWSETINAVYGTVKEVINTEELSAIRVQLAGSNMEVIYRIQPTTGIYVYHSKSGKSEISSIDNLSIGMGQVFLYSRYGYARDILIIEN